MIETIISNISDALYSYILIIMLVAVGLYFTVRSRFVQFRLFREQLRAVTEKPTDKGGVSSFQALMVSTASRVGTGNIIASLVILVGAGLSADLLWNIADITMGGMALINIPVILFLSKYAFRTLKNYESQKKAGKEPVFKAEDIGLPHKVDYWN